MLSLSEHVDRAGQAPTHADAGHVEPAVTEPVVTEPEATVENSISPPVFERALPSLPPGRAPLEIEPAERREVEFDSDVERER